MKKNFRFAAMAFLALATVACNKDDVIPDEPQPTLPPVVEEGNSLYQTKVFEYMPAPGQFVGEVKELWDADAETARKWAQETLEQHNYVSLGSFGGYIVVGFDHKVKSGVTADYDFAIEGNAFISKMGSSNEPGIVWVMQDVNGNGEPDDVWYQLVGSAWGSADCRQDFSVTYFRPDAESKAVEWTDIDGNKGEIPYLASFHKQPYYYPSWVKENSYTLRGTWLKALLTKTSGGNWSYSPYDRGYADNFGTDAFTREVEGRSGMFNGFKIANAVDADGKPVKLDYINFVKVQCAVMESRPMLGEASTEVLGFIDMNLLDK